MQLLLLKGNKKMFTSCQAYKPTEACGFTSCMNNLANEVKVGHHEPLGYATKTIDFHTDNHKNYITISSHMCKISPWCFIMLLIKQYATQVKHECTCTG